MMSTFRWNYTTGEGGPHLWVQAFPAASGTQQSPIDIQTKVAIYDQCLLKNPLRINYEPNCLKGITNTGHNWMVTVNGQKSFLSGGPLLKSFQLEQFHFHWGFENKSGSEHTIDKRSYAAELHLVHYNKDEFPSFGEAAKYKNGLAVLGIFLEVGTEHKNLRKLTKLLGDVKFSSQYVDLAEEFDITSLLPENTNDYWTYPGSLTTPPCYESVTWIVFKQPIKVSQQQMDAMRNLLCYCKDETVPNDGIGGKLGNNYRPTLPLGERKLSKSFQ